MSIVKDPALAEAGGKKIQWVRDFMPALSQIEARFLREKPFQGLRVAVSVHLEAKTATVTLAHPVEDSLLEHAVTEAGYTPVSISDTIDPNNKGETAMNKKIVIDGMMCMHCAGAVEKALNALDGVTAKVDLEQKCAHVELAAPVADEVLAKAVTDAGYTVVSIG